MSQSSSVNPATTYNAASTDAKTRDAVLVALHGDGWVECFAGRHIDVHIANMPYMTTPDGERLAEEFFNLRLPVRFRALYWPANRRAAQMMRPVRPSDIVQLEQNLAFLDAIAAVAENHHGERQVEGNQIWIA